MRIVPRHENYLLNVAYYRLRAEENLAYYVIGQGIKSYRIGDTHEILNQALLLPRVCCVWKTMGKKLKILAQTGLGGSQCCGEQIDQVVLVLGCVRYEYIIFRGGHGRVSSGFAI